MKRRGLLVLALAVAPWEVASSQCADGSPPPCRGQTVASAPARRPAPPLDEQTWIVVPFDNLNGNAEADWLRSGSVNLLYLGISRWTDVRVIDDERVADYMREVPGASDAKQLSLATGLAVAKRAGAGRLVMGDILKLGSRTTVNAKIFDVKSGQRVRTVREETTIPDSIMPMFGKLSQKVLNIAPPVGSSAGVVGTTSITAYQEYAQGMQALNRFELDAAQRHLNRALELDSTFALAHSKLAVLIGWVSPGLPSIRQHAEAAARLSGPLPPREKALIQANVAFSRSDYVAACDGFRALVKKDSTDTDAWYGLGDCLYHDPALELVPGDSARVRWRSERTAALRAFRTVLALDPTYHLAYQHLVDGYLQQSALPTRYCPTPQACSMYTALVRPSGDSLLMTPVQLPRDSAAFREQMQDVLRNGLRKVAMDHALNVVNGWLAANPNEQRAKLMKAATLVSMGRITESAEILSSLPPDSSSSGANAFLGRIEVLIKLWRAADALALYDSLRARPFIMRGGASPITIGNVLSTISPVFGQMSRFDSLVAISNRGAPPARQAYSRSALRVMAGLPSDSFPALFATIFNEAAAAGAAAPATRQLAPFLVLNARNYPPAQWPNLDSTATELRVAPAIAMQRRDTAALRRSARALDSVSRVLANAFMSDSGIALWAAESYLALGDSTAALNMARRWLDVIVPFTGMLVNQSGSSPQVHLPRAMLIRADLAAGLGNKDEARLWYGRFLAFFARAEPEMQPLVDRVKKAYAAVGGT